MLELFAIRFCPHTSKIEQWAIQSGWRMKDAEGGWRVCVHIWTLLLKVMSAFISISVRESCVRMTDDVCAHIWTQPKCTDWSIVTTRSFPSIRKISEEVAEESRLQNDKSKLLGHFRKVRLRLVSTFWKYDDIESSAGCSYFTKWALVAIRKSLQDDCRYIR